MTDCDCGQAFVTESDRVKCRACVAEARVAEVEAQLSALREAIRGVEAVTYRGMDITRPAEIAWRRVDAVSVAAPRVLAGQMRARHLRDAIARLNRGGGLPFTYEIVRDWLELLAAEAERGEP